MSKATLRTDIDALIDWYEKFRPSAGKKIPVNATIKDIRKAIMLPAPTKDDKSIVVNYCGRTLEAIK